MEIVKEVLEVLRNKAKTIQTIWEELFVRFPQWYKIINKNKLKEILKSDLNYYYGKPELRMVQATRDDVVLNR